MAIVYRKLRLSLTNISHGVIVFASALTNIVLFCISGCSLSRGFCSVPSPNLSAAYFQTSEKSSRSIHTKTKLNHKNNITKHNFIPNFQMSFSNRIKLAKST